ncbi:MAG: hypothetical protein M3Y46_01225, partial [Actinomycetota bacterium]|nr:hypothetical protein [Actinomycetota bacterium]
MKKPLAAAVTLLLAFGGVALSSTAAFADEGSAVEVVTTTDTTDTSGDPTETEVPDQEPATTEEPQAPEGELAAAEVVEVTEVVTAPPADETTGTDPPVATASRFAAPAVQTLDVVDYGIIGAEQPSSSDNNKPGAWVNAGPHDGATCYKYDEKDDDFLDNGHAYVINDGKTVVLKPYGDDWPGDHWELLVVKAATVDAVTIHPTAGTWYAGYDFKDISHYIVCKGTTPDETPKVATAEITTTPGTCEAAGSVAGGAVENATFGAPVYKNGQYTIVATATGSALFDAGEGVNDARTTKTFTGPIPPQNTELCTGTVTFCHAHPADTAANGWELMTDMPVQSVNGHKQHAADIIPPVPGILPAGLNWNGSFMVNGVELSAQEILRLGCDFGITVPYPPDAWDEYCWDGETQDGSITVYFGDLGDKIQYRITGGDGVDILIESGDDTTVYLPAGDYTVKAEAVAPYQLTGTDEWHLTIGSAVNCECAVDTVNKLVAFAIVQNPECAEAEVSVTPATCLAAAGLVLGDTLHATFGEPVIENGTYTVVAT